MGRRRLVATALLALLTLSCDAAKRKKKKRDSGPPVIPSDLQTGCPFHKSLEDADARELSEFGHELERDGKKPEALPCYAAAIRTSPKDSIGWLDLAIAQQYDDPQFAIRLYRQGLALKPTDHELYNQMGILLRTNGRQDEASRHFISAGRLKPNDADAFFHLGGTHDTLDRHSEALYAYRRALDNENKNEARIQNNIGKILGKLNKWGDAVAALREAQEADPTFPETQANLAHIFTSYGALDEAEVHLKAAMKLAPADDGLPEKQKAWEEKVEKRKKAEFEDKRRKDLDERDGPMTREQRVERFQAVIGRCGMDKDCMRQLLGQDDDSGDEIVRF